MYPQSPPETLQLTAPSDLKSPPATLPLTAPSDLKSPPETSTIREVQLAAPSDLKSPLETSTIREDKLAAPSDLKSPPVTSTIREDKDSEEEFEYINEREDSSEDEEDLGEYHTERETLAPIIPPFNQESLQTFTPQVYHLFLPSGQYGSVLSVILNRVIA